MVRSILIWPEPVLSKVSEPVRFPLEQGVAEVFNDLADTLLSCEIGIGLSAIQIGVPLRIVARKHKGGRHPAIDFLVNPEITYRGGGMMVVEEGCLSIPGIFEKVSRFRMVKVSYTDVHRFMQTHEDTLQGFDAQLVQHELEHLDGHMFVERLPAARREALRVLFARRA